MDKVKIGKVARQQKDLKGWLVGQFLPEGPFKDDNVEIYYKIFLVGDKDKPHIHPYGREYLIVESGKATVRIGDETLELQKGDYVAIPNNTPDCMLKIKETFTIIGIRYPSVPNNKILL